MGRRLHRIMRKVTIQNPLLVKVYTEKQEIHKNILKLVKEREKIERDMTKEGLRMQKLKDKSILEVNKLNIELGEFEYISEFNVKGNDVTFTVIDSVEQFKEQYIEQQKKAKEEVKIEEVKEKTTA